MAEKKTNLSGLTKALLQTAGDMHEAGLLDADGHRKITMRHLGNDQPVAAPISGAEIRIMREKAHLSQAVFARHLNVSPGYVSQLERGVKPPTGPALVLLDVIRRKGFEAIL